MFIHGDNDIKINESHSRKLFLKATSALSLEDETSRNQFGVNAKNSTHHFSGDSSAAAGVPGTNDYSAEKTCKYPVERHVVHGVGHNEVYASREWLGLLPAFIRRAELFGSEKEEWC